MMNSVPYKVKIQCELGKMTGTTKAKPSPESSCNVHHVAEYEIHKQVIVLPKS